MPLVTRPALKKQIAAGETGPLYVLVADAERWVKARAERDRIPVDAGAVRALVDRAGVDIVRLRGGLERVALYATGQPKITADDVKQVVPPTAEPTDFGISNAIQRND